MSSTSPLSDPISEKGMALPQSQPVSNPPHGAANDLPHTLTLKSTAQQLIKLKSKAEISDFFRSSASQQALVVSGGSNLVPPELIKCIVVQPCLTGIKVVNQDDDHVWISVSAAENWHELVVYATAQGWYGLENLALIPGWVGAAPVQNIGAYGREIKDFIEQVSAYDRETHAFVTLDPSECRFAYRDSVFKQNPRRWLITQITLKLSKAPYLVLGYGDLKLESGANPTPQSVLEAVVRIRSAKLPDWRQIPNCGSFFKNPVVSQAQADALTKQNPTMPVYPAAGGVKLAAGWLIEAVGLKGSREGALAKLGPFERQALVLVNHEPGAATQRDVAASCRKIAMAVHERFGVWLEPEPVWVDSAGRIINDPLRAKYVD